MKNIAIIPARGGSKRIPRKNIKLFLGEPIINYSVRAAQESELFAEIVVSTDDREIAKIAQAAGRVVPFFRSADTANDHAGLHDVIIEVLAARIKEGHHYDNVCCLLPTAPFVTGKKLAAAYRLMIDGRYHSVFPVVKYSYPIQRALKIEGNNVLMIWPENYPKRSQDLPPSYHDAGQLYWLRGEQFLKEQKLFSKNSGAIVVPDSEAQDIDEAEDWQLAEMKYNLLQGEA